MKAYLPLGAKGALTSSLFQNIPVQRACYRRHFGGVYKVSAYAFFNRLTLEATAFAQDTQSVVSSERETQAILDAQGGSAKFELEIFRRLALFGGVDARDIAYEDPTRSMTRTPILKLGRTESAARAGIRYRWSSSWTFRCSRRPRLPSSRRHLCERNESEALLIGIHYNRPKFFLNITGGSRNGSPANGSTFPAYTETTGSCRWVPVEPDRHSGVWKPRCRIWPLCRQSVLPGESPGNRGPVASRSATGPEVSSEDGGNVYPMSRRIGSPSGVTRWRRARRRCQSPSGERSR